MEVISEVPLPMHQNWKFILKFIQYSVRGASSECPSTGPQLLVILIYSKTFNLQSLSFLQMTIYTVETHTLKMHYSVQIFGVWQWMGP